MYKLIYRDEIEGLLLDFALAGVEIWLYCRLRGRRAWRALAEDPLSSIGGAALAAVYGGAALWALANFGPVEALGFLAGAPALLLAYFLPALLACLRGRAHAGGISAANLFLAWIPCVWPLLLVLALADRPLRFRRVA